MRQGVLEQCTGVRQLSPARPLTRVSDAAYSRPVSQETAESPAVDWLDAVLLACAVAVAVWAGGAEDSGSLRWRMIGAFAIAGLAGLARRRLGLGPRPAAGDGRGLGLAGALGTVLGIGLLFVGGLLVLRSVREPEPIEFARRTEKLLAEPSVGETLLADLRARSAECATVEPTLLNCPSPALITEMEARNEQYRADMEALRAEHAANELSLRQERRARWPFGAGMVAAGILLVAGVRWLERR